MKKLILILIIISLTVLLFSCSLNNKSNDELNNNYEYNGLKELTQGDRSFKLEELPESYEEETVILHFNYSISSEYDALLDIYADTEININSVNNEEKLFNEGLYIKKYIVHSISTLTEKEYGTEKKETGEFNPLYYYGLESCIDEFNLIEYKVINVEFTQTHTEKSLKLGAQWGNGRFSRSFIVGKSIKDNTFKIYGFGMM